MESNQAKPKLPKNQHKTFLGTLFFIVFNTILLSMVSWVLLEGWYLVDAILLRNPDVANTIQKIVNNNFNIIIHYHPVFWNKIISILHNLQSNSKLLINRYIDIYIINVFIGTIGIIISRFYLFIIFLPFQLLILYLLVIDGLVQRDIRKFKSSRESTLLFHRLKPMAKVSFFSLFFLYMIFPFAVPPVIFLIPMAILSGLFTAFAIRNFKKYL